MRDANPTVCQQFLESLKRKQEVKLEDSEKKKARYESILASKKIEEPVTLEPNIALRSRDMRDLKANGAL